MSPPDARRPGSVTPGESTKRISTHHTHRIGIHGTSGVQHAGALAVLDTGMRQLDGLAGLGAYAVVNGDPLDLVDVIAAVDRIGQRMRSALTVIDLRERQS